MKRRLLITSFALINLPLLFAIALIVRTSKNIKVSSDKYTVYWGTEPLLNYHYWANATRSNFTRSIFISRYTSKILSKEKVDRVLFEAQVPQTLLLKLLFILNENLKFLICVIQILRNASLICCSCEGFIFQHYKVSGFNYRIEFYLWKLAGIKVAIFPYGADSYVYSKVTNRNWLYGLITDYSDAAKKQDFIERRLKFFIRRSDFFLPGIALFDGMGRSDWITPSTLCIDTTKWSRSYIKRPNIFTVTHAPNHRMVKGTKYVIDAIELLKESGHLVALKLIENVDNQELQKILATESDLHVDQLFADGYGLNALESMSLGIPTVSNFQGPARDFFDQWSFTKECPIIVSSASDLAQTILNLMNQPEELREIGRLSREYVLKYHSYQSFSKNLHDLLLTHDKLYIQFRSFKEEGIRND
jgi:hypothetical protein